MEREIVDQLRFLSVVELQILSWLIKIKLRNYICLLSLSFEDYYLASHILTSSFFLIQLKHLAVFAANLGLNMKS